MTLLLGAWALDGQPIDVAFPEIRRRRMRAAIPQASHRCTNVSAGRLWLHATSDWVEQSESKAVAGTGFLALNPGGLQRWLEGGVFADGEFKAALPDGHYALAVADATHGHVSLIRSLSGGERLYYTHDCNTVMFASSIRALLDLNRPGAVLNSAACEDMLHTGHVTGSAATAFEGIFEVLAGHALCMGDRLGEQAWHPTWDSALRGPTGSPEGQAKHFKRELEEAIDRCVGTTRPVAVALSGGIDSSAIAAAAVEVVGPKNVVAYTYEFDDPRHSNETEFARAVCKRLGIRDHRVFPVTLEAFVNAIPEIVWRAESPLYWPKSFLLSVARHISKEGFDFYLTGFGVGSHMAYLERFARQLSRVREPMTSLPPWYRARFGPASRLRAATRMLGALTPPHPRLHQPLAKLMWQLGLLSQPQAMFPTQMSPLVEHLVASANEVALLLGDVSSPALREQHFVELVQRFALKHLISCVDVTRSEKSSREAGAARVSPAHFASTVKYAYYPVSPKWHDLPNAHRLRPGKYLLRLAYEKVLPDAVLTRKKSWGDAVASPGWMRLGRRLMQRALPEFPHSFSRFSAAHVDAVRHWEPHSIHASSLAFEFFHKVIAERESASPPTWAELIRGYQFARRKSA